MAESQPLLLEDRIIQLLDHFDIPRAHIAGSLPTDWRGLAMKYADRLASLSLVCPSGFDPEAVSKMASRVMVCHGDQGPIAERVRAAVAQQPTTTFVTLTDYSGLLWADTAVERRDQIAPALCELIDRTEQEHPTSTGSPPAETGEVVGLTYRVEGSGPPLILLPLALAPSQWEPLLPQESVKIWGGLRTDHRSVASLHG